MGIIEKGRTAEKQTAEQIAQQRRILYARLDKGIKSLPTFSKLSSNARLHINKNRNCEEFIGASLNGTFDSRVDGMGLWPPPVRKEIKEFWKKNVVPYMALVLSGVLTSRQLTGKEKQFVAFFKKRYLKTPEHRRLFDRSIRIFRRLIQERIKKGESPAEALRKVLEGGRFRETLRSLTVLLEIPIRREARGRPTTPEFVGAQFQARIREIIAASLIDFRRGTKTLEEFLKKYNLSEEDRKKLIREIRKNSKRKDKSPKQIAAEIWKGKTVQEILKKVQKRAGAGEKRKPGPLTESRF